MARPGADLVVPRMADLPGAGWSDLGDELYSQPSTGGAAELFNCVGSEFPDEHVVATASSPHFVRAPRQIVHGLGVAFDETKYAASAAAILSEAAFANCLGQAIAADFQSQGGATEMLAVDVAENDADAGSGNRVTFTGADQHGVQPVHLDIVVLRVEAAAAVLWFGDTPEPFAVDDVAAIVASIRTRAS